jgi:hypothetical protein
MKAPRKKVILAVFLWCFALLIIYVRSPLEPWVNLKVFEHQVKSNVNPIELQRWATNRLADRSSGDHPVDYYGTNFSHNTNFPSGFNQIRNYKDGVHIYTGDKQESIRIFDSTIGGPILVVGSQSLAQPTNGTVILWKPGIYFIGQDSGWW